MYCRFTCALCTRRLSLSVPVSRIASKRDKTIGFIALSGLACWNFPFQFCPRFRVALKREGYLFSGRFPPLLLGYIFVVGWKFKYSLVCLTPAERTAVFCSRSGYFCVLLLRFCIIFLQRL